MYKWLYIVLLSFAPVLGAWAESCPVDSVITTNKDGICTARTNYKYDAAGRTTMEQTIKMSTAGAITSGTKTTTEYYPNGKQQSVTKWSWSTAKNDWVGTEKIEYTYYPNGKIEWQRVYAWGSDDWIYKYAAYYEYSGNHQTLVVNYTGLNNEWIPNTRFENQYDAKGHEILAASYSSYNAATQTWIGDKKTVSAYDQWGHQILDEHYASWANGTWIGSSKVEYEFDADGNKLMTANYTWDSANLKWKGTKKEKTVLDADERPVQVEIYTWQNDNWVGTQKIEYGYGNPAEVTTYIWSNNAWVYATRETTTTTNGKITDISNYTYTGSDWQIQRQEQHIYSAGTLMQDITYQWVNGVKQGVSRTDYVYTNGIKTKTTTYIWDASIPDWAISGYVQFTYVGKQLTEEVEYSYVGSVAVGLTRKTYTYGDVVSTTTYAWNAFTSAWDIADYTAKNYTAGVLTSEEHCTYANGVQTGGEKTEYNGNVSVAYVWNNGWVNNTRITKTYTSGVLTNELTETWSGSAWVNSQLYQLQTNSHGETTQETTSQWQGGKWVITSGTKMEKTYNSKDLVTMEAHYTWASGAWIGEGNKQEYTYDTWNNISQTIKYKWNNGWVYASKTDWQYDAAGHTLLLMTWTSWTSANGWRGGSRTENAYNATGGQTMYSYYSWSTQKKKWQGITKYDYILDNNNNKIGEIDYNWDDTKWAFVYSSKKLYTYNSAGKPTQTITYSYNTSSSKWVESTKVDITYDSNNEIQTQYTYSWYNSKWVLTKSVEKIYDTEPPYNLRTESTISQNKSTGVVTSATIKSYHYACDPHITITALASPLEAGTIEGGGNYKSPSTITLTATPVENCYTFSHWDDGDTNATRTVVVTENKTYTAIFTPIDHPVHASVKGGQGGSVAIIINE